MVPDHKPPRKDRDSPAPARYRKTMTPDATTGSPFDGVFGVVPVEPAVDEAVNLVPMGQQAAGPSPLKTRHSAKRVVSPNKTRHSALGAPPEDDF